MLFGVDIPDNDILFKCALGLLSSLSALWLFILFITLWLCKIQRRVNKAMEAVSTGTFLRMPQISPSSYSDLPVNESDVDRTSVDAGYAQERDLVNGSENLALASEDGPPEGLNSFVGSPGDDATSVKRKIYKSLKCQTDASYAKLYEATPATDAQNNIKKGKEKGIKDDQEEYVEMDTTQADYENEYLAVIASDTPSGVSHRAEMFKPRQGDDSEYLTPIDCVPGEKSRENQTEGENKSTSVSTSERQDNVKATSSVKDGAQLYYDYVNPRVLKESKGPQGSVAIPQVPLRENKNTEDEKRISCDEKENDYLILISGEESESRGEDGDDKDKLACATKAEPQKNRQSVSEEFYESIHEGDNKSSLDKTVCVKPEVIYQNQKRDLETTLNVQYSDKTPFYENSNALLRQSPHGKNNPAFND
ncbi:hypothetical protein ABFA07_004348 [Porites harrisoni]